MYTVSKLQDPGYNIQSDRQESVARALLVEANSSFQSCATRSGARRKRAHAMPLLLSGGDWRVQWRHEFISAGRQRK